MTHPDRALIAGAGLALVSAAGFAVAGPFGKALADVGWSPVAIAGARMGCAALVLLPLAVRAWLAAPVTRWWVMDLVRYGILGVAGVQVCFYLAIRHAAVAPVLMIEFQAPVLLVIWSWLRTGMRPPGRVLAGSVLAMGGLAAVIGAGHTSMSVHPLGVAWAVAAASCVACYFRLADAHPDRAAPPQVLLVGGGLLVGAVTCALLAVVGVLPWQAPTRTVSLGPAELDWWLPVLGLALLAGVLAYLSGIGAVRLIGSRRASFLALTEVLFAAGVSWALIGERPNTGQALGAVVVLAGIVLVQLAGRPADQAPAPDTCRPT